MPTTPTPDDDAQPPVTVNRVRELHLNEDWAATIVGLVLLGLVLLGVIPQGLIP